MTLIEFLTDSPNQFFKNLFDQPNAHNGLGALSAWERPSPGIFSFPLKPTFGKRH
jgi:hypothetical protein